MTVVLQDLVETGMVSYRQENHLCSNHPKKSIFTKISLSNQAKESGARSLVSAQDWASMYLLSLLLPSLGAYIGIVAKDSDCSSVLVRASLT